MSAFLRVPGTPTAWLGVFLAVLLLALLPACRDGAGPQEAYGVNPAPSPTLTPGPPLSRLPDPPDRDLYRLTAQLRPSVPRDIPRVVNEQPVSYEAGREDTFWLLDLDSLEYYQRTFDLRLVTPHAYWYIDQGQEVEQEALERAAKEFETLVYPGVTSVFGTEWNPGVDNDVRLTILNSNLRGAAGYFSSGDQYPEAIAPYSNEREMININIAAVPVQSPQYLHVLAHELQHAVHWNGDRSEDTWVNEGLSELAVSLLGYGRDSAERFLRSGPTSLVHWPVSGVGSVSNYGAASLFMHYLVDHYGDPRDLKALVDEPGDGGAGIDSYLADMGSETTLKQVFGEWIVANYLHQFQPGDTGGPYSYKDLDPGVSPARLLFSGSSLESELPQYAAEYVRLKSLPGPTRLKFEGATEVRLFPARTGPEGCWWSNVGDSIASTLTRVLDLSSVAEPVLSYQVWHAVEEEWDYAYLQVSLDQGETWKVIGTPHTSDANPVGNSFGPGYTGDSLGWLDEEIDLAEYSGRRVLLRFQYVTDEAINGSGLCVRGFGGNAATGWEGDWQPDGFVLVDNRVAQHFSVSVVQVGEENRVTPLELDSNNSGSVLIEDPESWDHLVVVVGATAPKTRQKAEYRLTAEPVE